MAMELAHGRRGLLAPLDWLSMVLPNPWLQNIRIEYGVEGRRFVVRAEVPGVDPDQDVRVTCADGRLRLVVMRAERKRANVCSEFHYGRFVRTIPLPSGAREDTITATYDRGILEITVAMSKPAPVAHIPISTGDDQPS